MHEAEEKIGTVNDCSHQEEIRLEVRDNAFECAGRISDISSEEQQGESSSRREERVELALKMAGIGSWDWNLLTGEMRWTELMEPIFGLIHGEWGGTFDALIDLIHPEDRAHIIDAAGQCIQSGSPLAVEPRVIWPNGDVRWISLCGNVLRDKDGQAVKVLGIARDVTTRRQREDALRKSEEIYRDLVDSANDMIVRTDENGYLTFINPIGRIILGYPEEELMGKQYLDLIRPDYRKNLDRLFKLQTANRIYNTYYEFPAIKKGGEETWFAQNTQLIMEDAKVIGLQACARNITDRIKASNALKESERRYRTLIDTAGEGVLVIDSLGRTKFVNKQMADMLGYETEQVLGGSFAGFLDEYNASVFMEKMSMTCKGQGQQYDLCFRHKDGVAVWGIVNAAPLYGPENTIVGSFGMITDVTDRKRAEDELQRERELVSAVLDGSPVPTFMIDQNHRVVLWNRSVETMTTIPRCRAFGRTLNESFREVYGGNAPPILADMILDMTDEELLERYGHKVRRAGFGEAFEVTTHILPGGEKRMLEVIATRIRNHEGAVVGAIQCGQDVTDKLRLSRQLQQAQKMEALGTLAGGIAHDFNNILTSIIGYTEMALLNLTEGSSVRSNLLQVVQAGHRATELVQQILTFSRQREQEHRSFQVAPLVKETLKLMHASLPANIEIREEIELPPAGDAVLGDPTQIHQLIMNLCTNAADAMRAQGGVLQVRLSEVMVDSMLVARHPALEEGSYLRLSVSDTGHGIDGGVIERIFDPFFTTKEPGKGTGLGLAMAHTIVKNHGGAITVQSEAGKGSTFQVYLPEIEHHPLPKDEPFSLLATGSERILFVDDEAAVLGLAQEMLGSLGYQVTAIVSSTEALKTIRAQPDFFDLVITDLTMPHMTGIEFAKEVLNIRPDIPIILCTGFSETPTEEKARDTGIKEFVTKPFNLRNMNDAVRRALKIE